MTSSASATRSASVPPEPRRVVLETSLADASRLLVTLASYRAPAGTPLHYIAIAPQLPALGADAPADLRAAWPVAVPGLHRLALDGGVTLDLLVGGTAAQWLPEITARVDEFVIPEPLDAMRALSRLAARGAKLRVHAPDDQQLRALKAAGFSWQHAADEDGWLRADYTSRKPQLPAPPPRERRAIVIGAGVAGAAACERLAARGWQVTLIERHEEPAQEASGNRAGIFMPLLSKDDNIPTRLTRAAYLHAMRAWQRLGGLAPDGSAPVLGEQCGVLQLARDAEHAALQREVAEAWQYPREFVQWLDAHAASALLGSDTPHGAWLFAQGGWANPASVCRAMLAACGDRLTRIFHAEAITLRNANGEWEAVAADGRVIASAPTVVLANGAGATGIAQASGLPLYTMRGQVTHLPAHAFPQLKMVVCREAYMTPPVQGITSVGATYDRDDDRGLRAESQEENLQRAEEILGAERLQAADARNAALAGRVGFRTMAPDRLPLVGALPDHEAAGRAERLRDVQRHEGLYTLLGYASRGLIWAPLAAELLASQLEHEPLPLEATLAAALDPARFLLKARRKL
jgi:tRNA 5-methylaminomethyl-2-thiouridine biosynthesis bifunctional protein